MNAMTCQEVEEQLDLFAAAECEPAVREAVEMHLRDCQACAARLVESQRVLGLLDVHFNQAGVERLQQRIDDAAKPRPRLRIFTPFVRRAIAVAAVFLIAVGLVWWLPRGNDDGKDSEPQFALLVQSGKPRLKALLPAQIRDKATEAVAIVPLAARNGEAFREDLKQAQRGDKLPLPPEVALELVLVNAGKRAVEVRLGDAGSELSLDVPGEAVVRVTAPKAELPAALRPQTLQLEEGQRHVIHIDRLVAGSPGKLEYIYLTEPGEYKLTARLRLTADGRAATVTAEPVRIKVDR